VEELGPTHYSLHASWVTLKDALGEGVTLQCPHGIWQREVISTDSPVAEHTSLLRQWLGAKSGN
jgi:hypothetical protein